MCRTKAEHEDPERRLHAFRRLVRGGMMRHIESKADVNRKHLMLVPITLYQRNYNVSRL